VVAEAVAVALAVACALLVATNSGAEVGAAWTTCAAVRLKILVRRKATRIFFTVKLYHFFKVTT
jgi:hypothetical protein